jgi:hypothetical protein
MADELTYRASRSKAAFVLLASNLSGMEGAIANSYNAPLDEVLRTLNEWRARYNRTA